MTSPLFNGKRLSMEEKVQLNITLSKVKSQEPSITTSDEESVISISLKASDDCDTTAPMRYVLTGDNIDKNVSPRDMTLEHPTKSLHYFHAYAALSRIDFTGLSEETPTSLLRSLDTAAFLPSVADCQGLRENYVVLAARVICDTLTAFSSFKECVPKHILHKCSANMSKKSVTVSSQRILLLLCIKYHRSGIFRVKKLLYDKFSCKKIFVGTTPYHISVNSTR